EIEKNSIIRLLYENYRRSRPNEVAGQSELFPFLVLGRPQARRLVLGLELALELERQQLLCRYQASQESS
ncbi:MAG: hypothetical protein D3922_09245, partial [Candidatus Electrothrix sp. AR1]|nr:hypothetical protein [Candidatus Electrothrix sp. AR1]